MQLLRSEQTERSTYGVSIQPCCNRRALSTMWIISDKYLISRRPGNHPWILETKILDECGCSAGCLVVFFEGRCDWLPKDAGSPTAVLQSCLCSIPPHVGHIQVYTRYPSHIISVCHIYPYHTYTRWRRRIHVNDFFSSSYFELSHCVWLTWGANHPPKVKANPSPSFCSHTTNHCPAALRCTPTKRWSAPSERFAAATAFQVTGGFRFDERSGLSLRLSLCVYVLCS